MEELENSVCMCMCERKTIVKLFKGRGSFLGERFGSWLDVLGCHSWWCLEPCSTEDQTWMSHMQSMFSGASCGEKEESMVGMKVRKLAWFWLDCCKVQSKDSGLPGLMGIREMRKAKGH